MGPYRTMMEGQAVEWAGGSFGGTVWPPEKRIGSRGSVTWVVRAEDVLGEKAEKEFTTKDRALDFYTEVWLGISKTEAAVKASDGALPGRVTEVRRRDRLQLNDAIPSGSQATHHSRLKNRDGLNMRKVAEVLNSYGLDPVDTIAEVLVPVTVVDPETGVERQEHRLDAQQRAQVALELVQYTRPKLKAVEMKVEGSLSELSQDQIDARIKRLLDKGADE